MYNFILNPTAGKGKTLKNIEKIKKYLEGIGAEYSVYETKYPFHATEIASELSKQGCSNIIAVGGDGTVNEVLNGITDFDNCSLGIIPSGSGNDFSKFVGLPKDPIEAMNIIINNSPKHTDYMNINDKKAINVTGMGMDVTVLERCKKMKILKGKFQYIISLIITLLKFNWHKFFVSIDGGEETEKTVLLIAACNGKFFGGGMPISPKSDISDNYINAIIINKMKRWKIPIALINLYRGKLLKYDFVENILCKSIVLRQSNPHAAINVDGELYKNMSFNCSIVQNRLRLFRP